MVNVMNVEYLNKVPEWYKSNEKFDLVLSDDIDSLTTVAVVQSVHPNWNVEYFYDFDNIYASPDAYFKYMSSSDKDYVKNLQSQIRDTLIFEQFTYLNEDSQDGNSDEDVWGEIDAIENGYTVEEILEMPTASDVVA